MLSTALVPSFRDAQNLVYVFQILLQPVADAYNYDLEVERDRSGAEIKKQIRAVAAQAVS